MSQQEQTRLKVLSSVLVGQLPVGQAAEVLGISERHVRRILATYREEGAAALVHGNRGCRPANATSEATIAEVLALAATRYSGTNRTHLSELLMEREGIFLSRSTVRRIALGAGIASPRRRRPPKHRVRRQRMPQEGMLVQVDGSHHRWLEDRGPRFALLLAVDDATGTVPCALFRPEEDAMGYLLLIEGMIERLGVPLALYSDRHAVFKRPCTASAEASRTDPVRPGHAAVGHKTDLGPVATGREACRACGRDIPGQAGHRAATDEGRDHGTCQRGLAQVPAEVRRAVRGPGGAVVCGLSQAAGSGRCRAGSVFQVPPQGGKGQHGQAPMAHPATAAWHGADQLRRSTCGSP